MSEALKFQVGDTVQLRSGGPMMTVVRTPDADGSVWTSWFDQVDWSGVRGYAFPAEALELLTAREDQ